MWLAALIGVVAGTTAWLTAPLLVSALGGAGEVHAQAVAYLRWSLPGLPGMLVMLAATGTFRGLADARTPLVLSIGVFLWETYADRIRLHARGALLASAALISVALASSGNACSVLCSIALARPSQAWR